MQLSLLNQRPPALSITDITTHIRRLMDTDPILQDIWLEGEISNWSPASSGHIYFTLKDAKASIRCVIWRSNARRLSYRPRGSGEAILAHGRVSVYEASGAYQFYIDDIEPAGLGALYVEFERLKRKLAQEGLFDEERKRPLPNFPARIGVVTSPRAAALRDVLNVLARRYPLTEVILSPTLVQGETAPPQIVAALNAVTALNPAVDVILLIRGGGSIEDLWAFNDEAVARAVADSPIPVVTGVGHETDFTIVDFVADHRAPTPSAAAELVTPDSEELQRMVAGFHYQFTSITTALLTEHQNAVQDKKRWLSQLSPQTQIDNRRQQIDDMTASMARAVNHMLSLQREQLNSAHAHLAALNPKATLARGYAIVEKAGDFVTSVNDVNADDPITITVADGSFEATVK